MIAFALMACTAAFYVDELELTVDVDGPTEVDLHALIEEDLVRSSELALLRVTPTPRSALDLDSGFQFLGPTVPEDDDELARFAGTQVTTRFAPLDGVIESFVTTQPVCTGEECFVGYCFEGVECDVPFTLFIEPRDQVYTVDLRVQLHVQLGDRNCSGFCESSLVLP